MRKIGNLAVLLALAGSAAATISGCDEIAQGDEDGAATTGGLSIVEMDEAAGKLVLEYQMGGRGIRYDMRLGPEMPVPPSADALAANPDLPTHEVDVRILDAGGTPVLVQMGGHAFLDPTWETAPVESFDEVDRLEDLELVARAVAELRALELPPGLEQLRRAGIRAGLGVAAQGVAATGGWSTFKTLCRASQCVNNGNLVRLWQSILWADGKYSSTSAIDGDFGPNTEAATKSWQSSWVPSDVDGWVGPKTWGAAESKRLKLDPGGDICQGGVYRFTYRGSVGRSFPLTMSCSTLEWRFRNPHTGTWINTSYNY